MALFNSLSIIRVVDCSETVPNKDNATAAPTMSSQSSLTSSNSNKQEEVMENCTEKNTSPSSPSQPAGTEAGKDLLSIEVDVSPFLQLSELRDWHARGPSLINFSMSWFNFCGTFPFILCRLTSSLLRLYMSSSIQLLGIGSRCNIQIDC